jgi:hypothetical protein
MIDRGIEMTTCELNRQLLRILLPMLCAKIPQSSHERPRNILVGRARIPTLSPSSKCVPQPIGADNHDIIVLEFRARYRRARYDPCELPLAVAKPASRLIRNGSRLSVWERDRHLDLVKVWEIGFSVSGVGSWHGA